MTLNNSTSESDLSNVEIIVGQNQRTLKKTLLAIFVVPLGITLTLVAVGYLLYGKSVAEKVATGAVQPLFLAILSLVGITILLATERRYLLALGFGFMAAACWFLSADAGGGRLVERWESQVEATAWSDLEPMDCVIVLGGGTGKRPDGAAQLMNAGDRIVTAARLYHRGLTQKLITTGDVLVVKTPFGDSVTELDRPTVQTRAIWRELGVPEDAVVSIGGQNTSSEMRELATHPEWWEGKRCGLVTSAMHMPRALRLAEKQGIKVIPIPCNYFYRSPNVTMDSYMPKPDTLLNVSNCFKEWLGKNLGR